MNNRVYIKKVGGENASELKMSSQNIIEDNNLGKSQSVVISAIREEGFNTTDNLIKLSEAINASNKKEIINTLNNLKEFHLRVLSNKGFGENKGLIELVENEFDNLEYNIFTYLGDDNNIEVLTKENDYSFEINSDRISILGFGEVLSAKIFSKVINEENEEDISEVVDLSELTDDDNISYEELVLVISSTVKTILEEGKIPVIPGYIGYFPGGIDKKFGRGYSDATASMLALGVKKYFDEVILEIQKSVKGILSADPRVLDDPLKVKVIDRINYLSALEIIGARGAQAKLLNHHSLNYHLQKEAIKIWLHDPFKKEEKGTWITKEKYKDSEGIEFVGGRKNVDFISISSGNMGQGFMAKVSQVVDKKGLSIDVISTSETEISFTVDVKGSEDKKKVKDLVKTLRRFLKLYDDKDGMEFVEYVENKSLIFCVGQNIKDKVGVLVDAVSALTDYSINTEIISQGRLQRSIVFGVEGDDLERGINCLHDKLIN